MVKIVKKKIVKNKTKQKTECRSRIASGGGIRI